MPNWSYNTIVMQGSKEAVHKFIKIGLENSNLKGIKNIERDFDLLVKKALTKTNSDDMDFTPKETSIVYERFLSARTFLPSPDTFLKFDTTNYADKFPEAVKEQKLDYGVVGWYDYNHKTLGTKWNFELKEPRLEKLKNDKYRITFDCDTAWAYPGAWMFTMSELTPGLQIAILTLEESNAYAFCGYINNGNDITIKRDVTDDISEIFDDETIEEKQIEILEKLKADDAYMKKLREEVVQKLKESEKNPDLSEKNISSFIEERLISKAEDDAYEWAEGEENKILDSLRASFKRMLNKMLTK